MRELELDLDSDLEFDRLYPEWAYRLSDLHWTPLDVARRAVQLLEVGEGSRVLDVGSGVGKFCLVGALCNPAQFIGVEQRAELVDLARQTARRCGATRAYFHHANVMSLDWRSFDAFYLYNPFYEHVADFLSPIGEPIELSPSLYCEYVTATCLKLFHARLGARVVTYHGFGGPMPLGYRLIRREPAGTDQLELWERAAL